MQCELSSPQWQRYFVARVADRQEHVVSLVCKAHTEQAWLGDYNRWKQMHSRLGQVKEPKGERRRFENLQSSRLFMSFNS